MKKLLLISLLAILAFSCTDSSKKKYGVKAAIITYKSTMMGIETTKTVYFKDYGDIEANLVDGSAMGMTGKQHSILKEGVVYMYQDGAKEGQKMSIPDSISTEQNNMFSEESIVKEGGKKVGTEKILDKECTVYEYSENGVTSKLWIWKKILLKMSASQQGMEIVMEATELKETSDFPEGIFDLPKDVTFKEMKDDQQNMPPQEELQNPADTLQLKEFEDPNAKG